MDFQIVLVNNDGDREKIRNHLRGVQSAQRRKKIEQRRQASAGLRSQTIVSQGPLAWRRRETVEDKPEDSSVKSGKRPITTVTAASRRPGDQTPGVVTRANHPLTILGASPKNPFANYSIPWDPESDELFHFMMTSLGPCMYGYPTNSPFDIFRSQTSLSVPDPAALHVVLLMATNTMSRLAGRSLPGLRALYHRVEAIRLINDRFARFKIEPTSPQQSRDQEECLSETTILAVIALGSLEKRWQMIGDSEAQTTGLQQLIILKGGIKVLNRECPLTESALYGHSLVAPRLLNPGSLELYDVTQPQIQSAAENSILAAELIQFLDQIQSSMCSRGTEMLEFAFASGTGIFRLIAFPLLATGVYTDNVVLIRNRLRAAILFYVHRIITRPGPYYSLPAFLKHLHWLFSQQWIWAKSLRMLLFMMVNKVDHSVLADSDSAWKALRLITAMCLLSYEGHELIIKFLLDLLSGSGRNGNLDLGSVMEELGRYQE